MTLVSAASPESDNPADLCQQENHSMTPTGAAEPEFEEASPRRVGQGRRIAVTVLGVILAVVACTIIGLAFVQGSWWYPTMTDRVLDHESLARVEAIRDEADAAGSAPEAARWLNEALDPPNTDPTTVRAYLLAAQEALEAADDPKLAGAVRELRAIIQTIRQPYTKETTTPYPMPTLEWPW